MATIDIEETLLSMMATDILSQIDRMSAANGLNEARRPL